MEESVHWREHFSAPLLWYRQHWVRQSYSRESCSCILWSHQTALLQSMKFFICGVPSKNVSAQYFTFMLCFVGLRWSLNKWIFSLLWKMVSDSAVLTLVGSSFHHRGATTESRNFTEWHLFTLSDGVTSRPADVVEGIACAGACGLTSVWR